MQQDYLETRIHELEVQLEEARSNSLSRRVPFGESPPAGNGDSGPRVVLLEQENESLRSQLQLEQLQSASLKVRLGALESKFSLFEELLRGDTPSNVTGNARSATSPTLVDVSSPLPALSATVPLTGRDQLGQMTEVGDLLNAQPEEQNNSRLVAREVESLPRKLSCLQANRPSSLHFLPRSPAPVSSLKRRRHRLAPSTISASQLPPSLHQILSSITILPSPSMHPSTTTSQSRTRGTTGRPISISTASTCPSRRPSRRVLGPKTPSICSHISKSRRYQLLVRR